MARTRGTVAAILLGLALVALFVWWGWSSWELSKARHVLRQAYPQLLDELPQKRALPANDTALKLERAAAAMGLNWAPKKSSRFEELAKSIPEDAEKRFSEVKPLFSKWVEERLRAAAGNRPALPPEVETFLGNQQGALAAIRDLLVAGPLPRWEEDLSAGWEAPIPNLLSALAVARLLATDAFWQLEHGNQTAAERDFLAIRQLAAALTGRSDLISVLVGIHGTLVAVIGIRELPQPDPAWLTWVEELDLSPNLERSFTSEAYLFSFRCPAFPEEDRKSFFDPWRKFRCAQASRFFLAFAKAAREKPCLGGAKEDGKQLHLPGWMEDPESTAFFPNLRSALTRLQTLHVHASLTHELLLARLGRTTPAAGTITVDRGPCRALPLEVRQVGSGWSWRWTGKEPDVPQAWLPLAATLP